MALAASRASRAVTAMQTLPQMHTDIYVESRNEFLSLLEGLQAREQRGRAAARVRATLRRASSLFLPLPFSFPPSALCFACYSLHHSFLLRCLEHVHLVPPLPQLQLAFTFRRPSLRLSHSFAPPRCPSQCLEPDVNVPFRLSRQSRAEIASRSGPPDSTSPRPGLSRDNSGGCGRDTNHNITDYDGDDGDDVDDVSGAGLAIWRHPRKVLERTAGDFPSPSPSPPRRRDASLAADRIAKTVHD
eukprot:3993498-Pleurochrysis_carterae.AAC.1